MYKVGLTGGIATGKSYVLTLLADLGCETSDADKLAHAALEPGEPAFAEVVENFGKEILDENGRINRARLGAIVFGDVEKRQLLNSIVHPRVFAAQARWYEEIERRRPDAIAVVDAALMIETGSYRRFDTVVVVHCREDLQLARLMQRNHLSEVEARARISAQMPSAEKLKYADHVIDTSEGFADTRAQVQSLYEILRKKQQEHEDL